MKKIILGLMLLAGICMAEGNTNKINNKAMEMFARAKNIANNWNVNKPLEEAMAFVPFINAACVESLGFNLGSDLKERLTKANILTSASIGKDINDNQALAVYVGKCMLIFVESEAPYLNKYIDHIYEMFDFWNKEVRKIQDYKKAQELHDKTFEGVGLK